MQNINNLYKHKSVAILGLGISGIATYNFFKNKGYSVVAFDDNPTTVTKYLQQGFNIVNYTQWNLNTTDFIVVSPGIALHYPIKHSLVNLVNAHNQATNSNLQIICDVQVMLHFYPNHKYIAITGTNGKSTTASLVQHVLQHNNLSSVLLGNIGVACLSVNLNNYKYIVLELSSYQLQLINKPNFYVSAILNIQPDHLDYHGSFANYVNAKLNIFNNMQQNGLALLDSLLQEHKSKINLQNITIVNVQQNKKSFTTKYLKGDHNLQNMLFCWYICNFLQIQFSHIQNAIATFTGLPHRQQIVATFNNVTFVNDSKATNLESTQVALNSFNNIVLILGGINKVNNLDILLPYFNTTTNNAASNKAVQHIVLIGKSSSLFANILQANNINFSTANTLNNAVSIAYNYCIANGLGNATVMLSPACASFDMFNNYNHRGQVFTQAVNNLVNHLNKS